MAYGQNACSRDALTGFYLILRCESIGRVMTFRYFRSFIHESKTWMYFGTFTSRIIFYRHNTHHTVVSPRDTFHFFSREWAFFCPPLYYLQHFFSKLSQEFLLGWTITAPQSIWTLMPCFITELLRTTV